MNDDPHSMIDEAFDACVVLCFFGCFLGGCSWRLWGFFFWFFTFLRFWAWNQVLTYHNKTSFSIYHHLSHTTSFLHLLPPSSFLLPPSFPSSFLQPSASPPLNPSSIFISRLIRKLLPVPQQTNRSCIHRPPSLATLSSFSFSLHFLLTFSSLSLHFLFTFSSLFSHLISLFFFYSKQLA